MVERRIYMGNNKNDKKKQKKIEPAFSNDQLGENEIDRDMAQGLREVGKKKKK
jgi:hypothetical protein